MENNSFTIIEQAAQSVKDKKDAIRVNMKLRRFFCKQESKVVINCRYYTAKIA